MDSFDTIAKDKFKHLTLEDQKFAAHAMRVWFGYDKPKPITRVQKLYVYVTSLKEKLYALLP